jgi:hypothetical protein
MAARGDAGQPAALADGALSDAFSALATRITTEVAPVVEVAGCTARLLDAVERGLDQASGGDEVSAVS